MKFPSFVSIVSEFGLGSMHRELICDDWRCPSGTNRRDGERLTLQGGPGD